MAATAVNGLSNLIKLRGVGVNHGSLAKYKRQEAEDFPSANDEATSSVVFITYELTKTGVVLRVPHSPKDTKLTSMKVHDTGLVASLRQLYELPHQID